jgi:hypothetical protein
MAKPTKHKVEYFTTPPLKAVQVFLNEPSTKFKAEGEYSVKLVGSAEDFAELITKADRLIEEKVAAVLKEDPKLKKVLKTIKPTKPEYDDEGDETGQLTVNFKRVAKSEWPKGSGKVKINTVKLLDSEGNRVTDSVWSGSTLMVRYFMSAYFMPKDKEVGVSLKITHAIVVNLVSSGEGSDDLGSLGFQKVEGGYKAGGSKPASEDDDEAGEDASNDADDDNTDF